MTYGALQTKFDATNPPGAWYYKTGYLDGEAFGSDRFIDTLLEHCDFPTPSPLSRIFIEHLGGATGRVPADATAFVHRAALRADRNRRRLPARGGRGQHPMGARHHGSDAPVHLRCRLRHYLGADATPEGARSAYGPAHTRLVALKDRYDPTNFFRLNQNIRPTAR